MSSEVPDLVLNVSEFVALLNQTLEYAYPSIIITGELANFRVSKNRWVYFDLKDELATVKFFGTVYQLPGPLEDGMLLKVRAQPRLHPQYGFSLNVQSIQPAGEGTIRRAAALLEAKLAAEGLFDEARKRPLPYPPTRVGLITSKESAAYADFIKIINARWRGLEIHLIDVQVQGEAAPEQIGNAVSQFNQQAEPPEILVLIRGGGSAEDLQAFSTERVTRAVASSRIPTLVAIGHEIDISLAELAADQRASTPSNAAEMLVPDRQHVLHALKDQRRQFAQLMEMNLQTAKQEIRQNKLQLSGQLAQFVRSYRDAINSQKQLLDALNPQAILRRGFAIVRKQGALVRRGHDMQAGDIVNVQLTDAFFDASVLKVKGK